MLALLAWLAWTAVLCVGMAWYVQRGRLAWPAQRLRDESALASALDAARKGGAFAADGTPRWALVSGGHAAKRAYVFVGGLQRSGTTLVEAWLAYASDVNVSFLSAKHLSPDRYEALAPWALHNFSRAYFESVIASGGLEGKFVQDVYAYRNLFHEMGVRGEAAIDALALGAADVPRAEADRTAARARLLAQWQVYWVPAHVVNVAAAESEGSGAAGEWVDEPVGERGDEARLAAPRAPHYHIEKSPENVLIAPFLCALLAPLPSRLVVAARHPLVWALATGKWVRDDFVHMRDVAERIRAWLAVMEHAQRHALAPGALPSAVAVSVESFAAIPAMQRELLASTLGLDAAAACVRTHAPGAKALAGRALLPNASRAPAGASTVRKRTPASAPLPTALGPAPRPPSACAPLPSFIAHSYRYAACWLHGATREPSRSRDRPLQCVLSVDSVVASSRARRRQAELAALAAELEPRVRAFGFTFKPFLATRAGIYWQPLAAIDAHGPWADALVGVHADAWRWLPPGWLRPPRRPSLPSADSGSFGGGSHIALREASGSHRSDGTARVGRVTRGASHAERSARGAHVLVLYALPVSKFSASTAHSGMNQRFLQVIDALRALGCALHLVAFHSSASASVPAGSGDAPADGRSGRGDVAASAAAALALLPSQLHPPAVVWYAGTFEEQISAALIAARGRVSRALIFCTHITQNLNQQAVRDDARDAADARFNANAAYPRVRLQTHRASDEPPPLALPPERALHWARAALPRARVAVITDDVHHERVRTVLRSRATVDLPKLTRWLRRREGALYAGADVVYAVSSEDAARIGAGFGGATGDAPVGATYGVGGDLARVHIGEPLGAEAALVPSRTTRALARGGPNARTALRSLVDVCGLEPRCVGVRLSGACARLRTSMHTGAALALLPVLGQLDESSRLVLAKRNASARVPPIGRASETNASWTERFTLARAVRAVPYASDAEARAAELAHAAGSAPAPDGDGAARVRISSAHAALDQCAHDEACSGVSFDASVDSLALGAGNGSGSRRRGGICKVAILHAPTPPPASGRLPWSRDVRSITIARAGAVHARWLPFVLDERTASAADAVVAHGAAWVAGARSGLFYVGQPHPLAIAAVGWLCSHVLPLLEQLGVQTGGRAHLRIAGARWKSKGLTRSRGLAHAVARGYVTLLGEMSDDELDAEFARARVFAAPLVNATGIATKNVHALARGLPTVSGTDGARGLGFASREHAARAMLLSDDPAEFARHCAALIEDDARWAAFAAAGAAHVRAALSADRLSATLGEFVRGEAGVDDVLELHVH
ncbi:hypothetical protein KFE25_000933 [Diacronema lutheri]|uniref:Digalactosyldiacylglycerol synthase n=2 Tax=Diacronema lutheri TaxID=2081491 RepID=A0A8J6C298_DIALT|nr:hypothetical protein KFE25_000933 [Diacronema lutheri]